MGFWGFGVLGGSVFWNFLIRAPEMPFLVPLKWLKLAKMTSFSHFGGTKNGTSGARIKKFQKTDPPKLAPKTPD